MPRPPRASAIRNHDKASQQHQAGLDEKGSRYREPETVQSNVSKSGNAGTVPQKNGARTRWSRSKGQPDDALAPPALSPPARDDELAGAVDAREQIDEEQQPETVPVVPDSAGPLPLAVPVVESQQQRPNREHDKRPIAIATKFEWLDLRNKKTLAFLLLGILAIGGAIGGIVYGVVSSRSDSGSPQEQPTPSPSPPSVAGTLSPTTSPVAETTSAPTSLVLEQLGQTLFDPGTYTSTGPRGERLFGWAVDMTSHGRRLAASAPYCMCVFIYDFVQATSSWNRVAQVTHDAGVVDHISLSDDGSVLAIGIPAPEDLNIGGLVQVYEENGDSSWQELGEPILGLSSVDRLGGFLDDDGLGFGNNGHDDEVLSRDSYDSSSLSLSENGRVLAMGSSRGNYVRILRLDETVLKWIRFGDRDFLVGEDGYDDFGTSVDLSADGRRIIVGAPDNIGLALPHFEQYNGHVRVFQYVEEQNTWIKIGQDIDGNRGQIYLGEHVGATVSISADGSTIAVGANPQSSDDSGLWDVAEATEGRNGYAKVYEYAEGRDEWIQRGNTINVFHFGLTDGIIEEIGLVSNALNSNKFPIVTRLSGDGKRLALSVLSESLDDPSGRGLVRLYELRGEVWRIITQPIEGTNAYDHSGRSIALSHDGNILAIGAPEHNGVGSDFGQVRVFELNNVTGPTGSSPAPSVAPVSVQPNATLSVIFTTENPIYIGWMLICGGTPVSTVSQGSYNETSFTESFPVVDRADCKLSFDVQYASNIDTNVTCKVYYGEDTTREDLLIVGGIYDRSDEVVFLVTPEPVSVTVILEIGAFPYETGWMLICGSVPFFTVPTGTYDRCEWEEDCPQLHEYTIVGIENGSMCEFSITDTFADGISGFYNIYFGTDTSDQGILLVAGGDFRSSDSVKFMVSPTEDTITRSPSASPTSSPTLSFAPTRSPTTSPAPAITPAPSLLVTINVLVQFDRFPEETYWSLSCNGVELGTVPSGTYTTDYQVVTESFIVDDGDECVFTAADKRCCGSGPFSFYQVYYGDDPQEGIVFAEGSIFHDENPRAFTVSTVSTPTPTALPTGNGQALVKVSVALRLDDEPWATGWSLTCGTRVLATVPIATYKVEKELVVEKFLVRDGIDCQFLIEDLNGNGIRPNPNDDGDQPYYRIYYGDDTTDNGILLAAGGWFDFLNVVSFVVSPDEDPLTPTPTSSPKFPSPAPSTSFEPTGSPSISPQPTTTTAPTGSFEITLTIQMDRYPYEIGWSLSCDNRVISAVPDGSYTIPNELVIEAMLVPHGASCVFLVTDSYGDGLCCGGYYQINDNDGNVFARQDGFFSSRDFVEFAVPSL